VGIKWIYSRRRDELEAFAEEFKFSAEGKVEDLRRSFALLVSKARLDKNAWARLAELEVQFTRPRTPQPEVQASTTEQARKFLIAPSPVVFKTDEPTTRHAATSHPTQTGPTNRRHAYPESDNIPSSRPCGATLDRIRKWGIQFDGQGDPLAFVEALEERAQAYGIEVNALPRSMTEGLIDSAARWFRTSGLGTATWSEFRREFLSYFLPPRYFER
ncbi:hypothetical protein KR044_001978, partial [Drosophila immigrans]